VLLSLFTDGAAEFQESKALKVTVRHETWIRTKICLPPKDLPLDLCHVSPKLNGHPDRIGHGTLALGEKAVNPEVKSARVWVFISVFNLSMPPRSMVIEGLVHRTGAHHNSPSVKQII
jgi:hypothetical protein